MLNRPARFGETNNVCRDSIEEPNPHDNVILGFEKDDERRELKAA